jgi:ribosomal protein S18 acetylase RimI-like enzyme
MVATVFTYLKHLRRSADQLLLIAIISFLSICYIQHNVFVSAFLMKNQRCLSATSRTNLYLKAGTTEETFIIQKINQDNMAELEEMSSFCIDIFHNKKEENDSLVSTTLNGLKLAMLQKAQMIDLSAPFNGNRCIFIARAAHNNTAAEIIGCSEVIEERVVISQQAGAVPRVRPIIENLAVKKEYRRQGVGKALLDACEQAIQTWIPFHDDICAQVEEGNDKALQFFSNSGYEVLFTDKSCTKDFSRTNISKMMLSKKIANS